MLQSYKNWRTNTPLKVYKRLKKSSFSDELALVSAELYLSHLELKSTSPFLRACSLAGIGKSEQALELLTSLPLHRYKNTPAALRLPLIRRMYTFAPDQAVAIARTLAPEHPDLLFMLQGTGHPSCPFLAINAHLDNKQAAAAKPLWKQLFTKLQLAPPAFPLEKDYSLSIERLSCPSLPAVPSTKKVSIIVSAYNAAQHIELCLNSLLQQTWENTEIIVVDDASSDSTYEITTRVLGNSQQHKVLRNAQNQGSYPSRNTAIQHSSGEYVMNHDADDWAHPQKVEQLVREIESTSAIACTSRWVKIDEQSGRFSTPHLYPLLRHCTNSILIERPALVQIGGYDPVRIAADEKLEKDIFFTYGPNSLSRLKKPLTVGNHSQQSLTASSQSSLTSSSGLYKRCQYRESWLPDLINNSSFI